MSSPVSETFNYEDELFSIKNFRIEMSSPVSETFNYEDELFSIKNFQISKAYFINGFIRANVSWKKINDHRVQQYDLHWIESQCHSDSLSCCYRRDAVTIENFFQLYDLRFNCTYVLKIRPIVSKLHINKSFQVYFNVSSCQSIEIYGTIRPSCQANENYSTSISSPLFLNLIVKRNQSGIQFYWNDIRPFGE